MESQKRILVIGAGGIGGVVGGLLAHSGQHVTLVDQWVEHVEQIKRQGLVVETPSERCLTRPQALHISELSLQDEPFDMAFIAVKSYDTEWATMLAKPYVDNEAGIFVVFQNGINDERVAALVGCERTLGCIVTMAGAVYDPGVVMRTDNYGRAFKIAEFDGADTSRARALVEILRDAGDAEFSDDLWGERWSKLALNCMTNPLAGISGYSTAETALVRESFAIGVQLAAEVALVAKACGQQLHDVFGISPEGMIDAARGSGFEAMYERLCEKASQSGEAGVPSFGQDVMKGRRTEIDFLNGYVVERGREVGVETPFNTRIVEIVHELGIGFKPNPSNLAPLIDMLP